MERPVERIERLNHLIHAIVLHPPEDSFSSLIEENTTLFQGFNIAYSTNSLESNFSGISLASIEQKCTSLKKFFYGSGLLFYSDIIYQQL